MSKALDALEEKWRTEPADLAEWANRATRTLNLARMWKRNSEEWERLARSPHEPTREGYWEEIQRLKKELAELTRKGDAE